MKTTLTALLRQTRGSATAEALVMVPVLTVIWAGILFAYHRYESGIETAAEARRCAMTAATTGCRASPGCSPDGGSISLSDEIGRVLPAFTRFLSMIKRAFGFLRDLLGQIDELGFVAHGGSVDVRYPSLLGGGSIRITDTQEFQCREVPFPDLGDVLTRLFCRYTPFC